MKTVYSLPEDRLMKVVNASEAGIFTISPTDPTDNAEFIPHGSYRVHAWEIGDPANTGAQYKVVFRQLCEIEEALEITNKGGRGLEDGKSTREKGMAR